MAAISSAKREFLSLKRAIGPKKEADISLKRTKRYYTLLCKIDAKYIKGVSAVRDRAVKPWRQERRHVSLRRRKEKATRFQPPFYLKTFFSKMHN